MDDFNFRAKITKAINESGLIEDYIKRGVFSKNTNVDVIESDYTGEEVIAIYTLLHDGTDYGFINELQEEFASLFEGEIVLVGHNVFSNMPTSTLIEFSYHKLEPVQYDFSKTQEYLQGHCPPDLMAHYCAESLCDLWEVAGYVNDLFEDKDRTFQGIAATLRMCKKVFDDIGIKESPEKQIKHE